MIHKIIPIEIDYKKLGVDNFGFQASMTLYIPSNIPNVDINRKRPTVIVCPGGGYGGKNPREGEPIALKFVSADFNAVVLDYSVDPIRFPAALMELSKAVAVIRDNADEWNVDVDKIIVCGGSAGGHLAANFATLWNREFVKNFFGYKNQENKPNGMILSYPVITDGEKCHKGSFERLLGDKVNDKQLTSLCSCEKQVNDDTPPAFIWHTFTDQLVPVENSLLMASALIEKGISTELHIFPEGRHGLSLANATVDPKNIGENPECSVWIDMAIRWIKGLK